MANEENLRPPYSSEEAREYGRKGGIASGKSKREKRYIKETIEIILNQPIRDEEMLNTMKVLGFPNEPKYKDYLVAMIMNRTAESGSVMDLVRLTELLGETPNYDEDMFEKAREILASVPSVIDREEGD